MLATLNVYCQERRNEYRIIRSRSTGNRPVVFVTNKNIFQDMETFIFYTSTGRNSIDSINSLTARLTLSHL